MFTWLAMLAMLALKRNQNKIIICIFFSIAIFSAYPETKIDKQPLRIAAIQFKAERSIYGSIDAFSSRITGLVNKTEIDFHPDLVIFPEYTLVFLGLVPFYKEIGTVSTIEEALGKIMSLHPQIRSLKDIFLLNAGFVKKTADDLFGQLSKQYGKYIIAGTCFYRKKIPLQKPKLFNRAFIYNPKGKCFYTQDKVSLTDFEKEIIGLTEGKTGYAQGFIISGYKIGITICRDTYSSEWEQLFGSKDLWIDIKANGELFTDIVKESFDDALPARIRNTDVPTGITVCLTGSFFDMFWEGESSVIRKTPSGIEYKAKSYSVTDEEIIYTIIEP